MALRQAKVQPTIQEKNYLTIQMLEAGYMHGNKVDIIPVEEYSLTSLSGEQFTYSDSVETYIIYDDRPKVSILKKFGWYREDEESIPQIAYIPTHLLYNKATVEVIKEVKASDIETSTVERGASFIDGLFTLYGKTDGSTISVSTCDVTDGTNYYTKTIKLTDGTAAASVTEAELANIVKIVVDKAGTIKFVASQKNPLSSTKEVFLKLYGEDAVEISTSTVALSATDAEAMSIVTFEISEAGTYYIGANSNGFQLYSAAWIYEEAKSEVINELVLDGTEYASLVKTGISDKYELKPLKIIRGTLLDVYYDFLPDAKNRFYVVDVHIDTVSINYTCKLMPYKYDKSKEGTAEQNPSNNSFLKFDSDKFGI